MRVLVIGGGIGGLTTALALHAAGLEVEVHEGAGEVRPLGVGINLQPHAVRELTELGLGEALAETGVATRELVYANRFGQVIWREDRGRAAGYHWPQYSIHRGRLQMLLLAGGAGAAGARRCAAATGWSGFTQDARQGHRAFADGDARPAATC